MLPNVLKVGPVSFHLYGLVLGLGIVAAVWVLEKIAKSEGMNSRDLWRGLLVVVVCGLVGARLYHVIDYGDYYANHLIEVFYIWNGGLGIYGAIVGGILGMWWYTKRRGLDLAKVIDAAAIVMPLGQSIGRWGNYVNQELYGLPTELSWGIKISLENRLAGYESNANFHPLFLYESLGNLVLFVVLYTLWRGGRFKLGEGVFLAGYMIGYGLLRWGLEFLRIDSWRLGGLRVAQLVSLGFIMVGVIIIWRYQRNANKTNVE